LASTPYPNTPAAMPYDILNLDKELPVRVKRDFQRVFQLLNLIQVYENTTGLPTNDNVNTNSPVWNRASSINADGTFNTSSLSGLIQTLQIADAAITAAKVAVAAIQTVNIADNAITDSKIAAGVVTEDKTNWQTHILF
jgi:hypothetical protein